MSKVEEKHREAAAEALNKTGCQGVCHCHSKYIAQAIADAEERGRTEKSAHAIAWERCQNALAEERAHADRLAAALRIMSSNRWDPRVDAVLADHRQRREGKGQ